MNSQLLNVVTYDQKLEMLREIIGFSERVPGIDEFVESEYYVGKIFTNVFPIWRERLRELFPNNVTTASSFVAVKGAIGTGKTTFAQLVLLYDIAKLICMRDPSGFFDLMNLQGFYYKFFSIYKWKAEEFVNTINAVIYDGHSDFFASHLDNPDSPIHRISVQTAKNMSDMISEDLVSSILSEINFIDYQSGTDLINQVISRTTSRFQKGLGLFNHIILDSSDTDVDSPIETFVKDSPYSKEAKVWSTPIWVAKSHQGIYFNEGSFKVYAGDSQIKAHIIDELEDTSMFDPERIIEVPGELRKQYESDIYLALQETAGMSVVSTYQFFSNPPMFIKSLTIKKYVDDIVVIDFFAKSDTLLYLVEKDIMLLPVNKYIYGRLDLGVTGDLAGIALGYASERKKVQLNNEAESYQSLIKIPIIFAMSRYAGQETPINIIRDFFIGINEIRPIKCVTTDQYQSTQLRQELIQAGIDAYPLSVDRDDNVYTTAKVLTYSGLVEYADSPLFKKECLELRRIDGKVDHPPTGSKDLSDAAMGVVFTIHEDGEAAFDLPNTPKINKSILEDLVKEVNQNEANKRALFEMNLRRGGRY